MHDRVEAVALLEANERRRRGWSRAGWRVPCAEAADLRGINTLMLDFYDDPAFVRDLFEFVVEMELAFARAQVEAGADMIGVGDAAASLVGPAIYRGVRAAPTRRGWSTRMHAMGARVRLHICGNTRTILEGMGELGCDIVDLDFPVPAGRGARDAGSGPGAAGEPRPGRRAALVHPGGDPRRHGSLPPRSREPLHRGRRLRDPRATPHEHVDALVEYARSVRPDGSPAGARP